MFARELKVLRASKFRHARGFCVNLAYQYLAYREGYARFSFDAEDEMVARRTAFAESAPSPKTLIRDLVGRCVKFVCFNDGLGPEGCDWEAFIEEALGPTFDVPSRWEVTGAGDV